MDVKQKALEEHEKWQGKIEVILSLIHISEPTRH